MNANNMNANNMNANMNAATTSQRLPGDRNAAPRGVRHLLQRYPLLSYFVLAYGLAWLVEIPSLHVPAAQGHLPQQLAAFVGPLAGPALSAFLVAAAVEGKAGVVRLLRGFTIWRVGRRWYAFALLGIPFIMVLGTVVLPGALRGVGGHGLLPAIVLRYLAALLLGGLIGGPFLEEFGWRGFALPRMQARFGPLWASLLLGVLWAFWHIPFFLPGGFTPQGASALQIGEFVLSAVPIAVIMTWIYNHTRGSLLLASLTHASVDATSDALLPALFPIAVMAGPLPDMLGTGAAALLLIVLTRGRLGLSNDQAHAPRSPLTRGAPVTASAILLACLLLPGVGTSQARAASATPSAPSALSTGAVPPAAHGAPLDADDLERYMDGAMAIELAAYHIPGATVAVVKDGRLLFAKGYGYADVERGMPVVADHTLFRVGSVSKLFTWTAVMQLKEQGKLDLHTDVNRYLKTFQIPDTFPGHPITLAHLLTHTAGFEERVTGIFARTPADLQPLGTWLAHNIPARVHAPSEVTAYSNYGAALAGYIVQQVSGEPFDQYVERHLYAPLAMAHSSFRQPPPASLAADVAVGYDEAGGAFVPQPFEVLQIAPAGSMSATATDMANFMIAHLQNGTFGDARILQEATAREMHAQHFTYDPRLPGMAYGFYEERINGLRLVAHGGDTTYQHSLLALVPEKNLGFFVSYNGVAGRSARYALLQAFLDRYFPADPSVAAHSPTPLPGYAERAAKVSGTYWTTRHSDTTYEKLIMLFTPTTVSVTGHGHIALAVNGGDPVDLVEVAPYVFRQVNGQDDGAVLFQTDVDGDVQRMILGNVPVFSFEKMPWYATPGLHFLVLALILLTFLLALVIWPIRFFLQSSAASRLLITFRDRVVALTGSRSKGQLRAGPWGVTMHTESLAVEDVAGRGRVYSSAGGPAAWAIRTEARVATHPETQVPATAQDTRDMARLTRTAHWSAGIAALLDIALVMGLWWFTNSLDHAPYGIPPMLVALLTLGLVSLALTIATVIFATLAWRNRWWSQAGRIFYTLVALAAVAFVAELAFWNLLGYRF